MAASSSPSHSSSFSDTTTCSRSWHSILLSCDAWRCHPACSLRAQRLQDLSRMTSIFLDPKSSQAPLYRPVGHPKFLLQVGLSSDDWGLYLVPLLQHALQPLCLVSRCLDGSVVPVCGCASSASSLRVETCARSFPSKSVRQKSSQPTFPVLACVTCAVQALARHPARVSVRAFILVWQFFVYPASCSRAEILVSH